MKRITVAILAITLCAVSATHAETQRRHDGTYTWNPREWHWDKKEFDTPPMPAGGYDKLVGQLSYPAALRSRRIEGRGVAIISIDATGRVGSISFSPRMAPQLEEIVVGAVNRTRFLPARRAGKPVASKARFPVTFVAR